VHDEKRSKSATNRPAFDLGLPRPSHWLQISSACLSSFLLSLCSVSRVRCVVARCRARMLKVEYLPSLVIISLNMRAPDHPAIMFSFLAGPRCHAVPCAASPRCRLAGLCCHQFTPGISGRISVSSLSFPQSRSCDLALSHARTSPHTDTHPPHLALQAAHLKVVSVPSSMAFQESTHAQLSDVAPLTLQSLGLTADTVRRPGVVS
jgi:hypothetical protein